MTFPAALERGRALFNDGRYFEAHETWEEAWLVERGPARVLLQGLIQIAAGFYQARRGRARGCLRLLEAGLGRIRRAEIDAGLELPAFGKDVQRVLTELRDLFETSPLDFSAAGPFPRLERGGSPD